MSQDIQIALLSGGFALSGVLIAQAVSAIQDWRNRYHTRQVLLRQKYEEMALAYSESVAWFGRILSCKSISELHTQAHPSDAHRVYALCSIYFPPLQELSEQYLNAHADFAGSIIKATDHLDPVPPGSQAQSNGDYQAAHRKLQKIKMRLFSEIKANAYKYTKA